MDYLNHQLLPPSLHYRLLDKIHVGSHYTVYKAVHRNTNQPVAIKIAKVIYKNILHAKSLFKDTHLQRQSDHPNIAKIYEVYFETDSKLPCTRDTLYIVMEYVPYNLKYVIHQQYLLNYLQVFSLAQQLLSALLHLHSRNLLHLNLIPEHILLDQNLNVKLTAFADANLLTYNGILEETHKTSRFYRAPEMILLSSISTQTDIWSFGCIFAELASLMDEQIIQGPLFLSDSCFPMSPKSKGANESDTNSENHEYCLSNNDLLIKQLTFCKDQKNLKEFDLDENAHHYLQQCLEVVHQKNYENSLTEKIRQMTQCKQSHFILQKCLRFNPLQRINSKELAEIFSLQEENPVTEFQLPNFELLDHFDLKILFDTL